jgi:hypothetical protein
MLHYELSSAGRMMIAIAYQFDMNLRCIPSTHLESSPISQIEIARGIQFLSESNDENTDDADDS